MKAMAHEIGDRYVSATRMLSDMDEFRKNPSLLFDYNTPPLDDVMKMPPPLVLNDQKKPAVPEPETKKEQDPIPFQKLESRSRNRASDAERAAKQKTVATREKQREQKKRQAEESSSRAATIAIIVCAIVAVIAIGILLYFLFTTPKEELVRVPNLISQEYSEGMTVEGLKLHITKDHNEEVPEGKIFEQQPAAGEEVVKGTTLYITVSMGKTPVDTGEIIDYSGEDLTWTLEQLDNMHLDLKYLHGENYAVHYAEVEAGKVAYTEPKAGSMLKKGDTVIIYISKGPGDGEMPSVTEKIREQAIKELNDKNLGLVIKEEEINDSKIPAGFVIKTEPVAGTQIVAGQTVKIYISKGPEMKTVPNVKGMSLAQAQVALKNAGFTEYAYDGNTGGNVVIEQSLKADAEAAVTETITLTLGVKKNVPVDCSSEDPTASTKVKVVRDGAVVIETVLAPGVNQLVLEDQIGNGEVTYMVYIGDNSPPEELKVQF